MKLMIMSPFKSTLFILLSLTSIQGYCQYTDVPFSAVGRENQDTPLTQQLDHSVAGHLSQFLLANKLDPRNRGMDFPVFYRFYCRSDRFVVCDQSYA